MFTSYAATMEYLYSKLPMFTRIGASAIKKDLTNITKLCDYLGNPQNQFKSIHIAGTNGKGSVSNLLASAYFHNGYKVGLHTSPHLIDYRERFRIDTQLIEEIEIIKFVGKNHKIIEEIKPSFFELSVALAFYWFAENEVDIAIIETGLGGRLDSTNILKPILSVITHISYDHKDMLGETLEEIATEKAGIIKKNTPVVLGLDNDSVENVFQNKAELEKADLYKVKDYLQPLDDIMYTSFANYTFKNLKNEETIQIDSELIGKHQQNNIATAWVAMMVLNNVLITQEEKVLDGFRLVKSTMKFRGRWDIIQEKPLVIADSAHNEDALKRVFNEVKGIKHNRLYIIIGFMKDKDLTNLISIMPKNAFYIGTTAELPRSATENEVAEMLMNNGLNAISKKTVEESYDYVMKDSKEDDLILITGSIFIVGKFYEFHDKLNGNRP